MQVHPPRAHTFNGSVPSFTSSHSSYSHTSSPSLSSGRISGSRLRGARAYTHPNPPIDEGFYSTPSSSSVFIAPSSTVTGTSTATASPTFSAMKREKESPLHHIHANQVKAKIKPVLKLMKDNASGRTSRNSLDLSKPGGGEAAKNLGLGIYGSGEYMYGYDDDSVPRGRRSISGTGPGFSPAISAEGGYTKTGQYIHPRRQMPRPYTPTAHCSDENESSDEDVDEFGSRGYYSGEYSRGNSIDCGSRRPPQMRMRTDSAYSSPMLRTSTATTGQLNGSPTCSIITPITTSHASSSLLRPSARRTHSGSGGTTREPSPSFAASVTAARLAWDAKEAHKEQKREQKRRKSEQKEREKAESRSSKDISRSSPTMVPVWTEEMGEKVDVEEDSVPEFREPGYTGTAGANGGTGKKWGMASGVGTQPTWVPEKKNKGPGLKKRWLGFVVWIRISLVKMGRKFGGSKSKVRKP